jgi:hypothetical protein
MKDAYAGLKALAKRRLGGRPRAELLLAEHERVPEAWRDALVAELAQAGADHDLELVAAAQALMKIVDAAGAQAGRYKIDARDAQGIQIGDHNRQSNVFHNPPGGWVTKDDSH